MSPTAADDAVLDADDITDVPGTPDGLGGCLRGLRFLATRLFEAGADALERDLDAYIAERPDGLYAQELRTMVRQEADLLVRHWTDGDLACTLHSRLTARPELLARMRHVADALPAERLEAFRASADLTDPRLVRVLTRHTSPVNSLVWSPDGRYLATLGLYDTTVRVWDTRTWEQVHVTTVPHSSLDTVFWSPYGRRLAVVGQGARFRDAEEKYEPGNVFDIPSMSAENHVHTFLVFDTESWAEVGAMGSLPRASLKAPAAACAPDGESIAVAGNGGVWLWRYGPEETYIFLALKRDGKPPNVDALAWHPESGLAALVADRSLTIRQSPETSN